MAADPVTRVLRTYPVVHNACRQRRVAGARGRGRVSAHQVSVLAQLDRRTPYTVSVLASAMGVSLPTISLLVDRLVRAGLIRKDRDPADRRRIQLRLTAAGERVVESRSLLDADRVRALLGSLTPEELTLGVEGLATLAQAARRMGAGPVGDPGAGATGGAK
jgi:DNA-binding MarR family transcriptional regulator